MKLVAAILLIHLALVCAKPMILSYQPVSRNARDATSSASSEVGLDGKTKASATSSKTDHHHHHHPSGIDSDPSQAGRMRPEEGPTHEVPSGPGGSSPMEPIPNNNNNNVGPGGPSHMEPIPNNNNNNVGPGSDVKNTQIANAKGNKAIASVEDKKGSSNNVQSATASGGQLAVATVKSGKRNVPNPEFQGSVPPAPVDGSPNKSVQLAEASGKVAISKADATLSGTGSNTQIAKANGEDTAIAKVVSQ